MGEHWAETLLEVSTTQDFGPGFQQAQNYGFREELLDKGAEGVPLGQGIPGARIGSIVDIGDDGFPLVDFPENPSGFPVPAQTTVAVDTGHIGRAAVLVFEGADPQKPVIVGLLQPPRKQGVAPPEIMAPATGDRSTDVDQERLVITAPKEIIFRCGQASITLTRAGKILICGTFLLNRSTGVNRIQGGSVQIN
jgi:hypothetical protein